MKKDKIVKALEGFSGAEIKAVATEAGYFAIREDRTSIKEDDIFDAIRKVSEETEFEGEDFMNMFG